MYLKVITKDNKISLVYKKDILLSVENNTYNKMCMTDSILKLKKTIRKKYFKYAYNHKVIKNNDIITLKLLVSVPYETWYNGVEITILCSKNDFIFISQEEKTYRNINPLIG